MAMQFVGEQQRFIEFRTEAHAGLFGHAKEYRVCRRTSAA
jgi:hypothetical protein